MMHRREEQHHTYVKEKRTANTGRERSEKS
jgi:hypothetical protein